MLSGFLGAVGAWDTWARSHVGPVTHHGKYACSDTMRMLPNGVSKLWISGPFSVLTQSLMATLWKAFCFPNKIPGLMLSAFTSQTQGSPDRWKQKLALCLLLVSAFVYPFTQHQASRRPAFVIPAVGVAMD